MTWNGQFCLSHSFSNLFPPKQLRWTLNGKFCPNCTYSNLFPPKQLTLTWNGQFCPIHDFQSFPSKAAQIDWERSISPNSELFQSFPTKVAQNDSEWPILPICKFSHLFLLKQLRMTRNSQYHLIHNFSHRSESE